MLRYFKDLLLNRWPNNSTFLLQSVGFINRTTNSNEQIILVDIFMIFYKL